MGRKKKGGDDAPQQKEAPTKNVAREPSESDVDDSDAEVNYDIDPEITELACAFGIGDPMAQRLNNIMCSKRQKTWEQDLSRLHEILKTAHSPSAMLAMKINDMEKGMFAGKCKSEKQVRELADRHRLDKTATNKLVEAIAIREAMGKDAAKDLEQLDEHLQNSNAPSKLVSMKLESMRKGFPVGHCVYAREPTVGVQAPGVDGVFDKKDKKAAGYSDRDLQKRFSDNTDKVGGANGGLMDEAAILRLMAKDREKTQKQEIKESSKKRGRKRDDSGSSRSRSMPKRKRQRSRSASRRKQKQRRSRSNSRARSKRK